MVMIEFTVVFMVINFIMAKNQSLIDLIVAIIRVYFKVIVITIAFMAFAKVIIIFKVITFDVRVTTAA